MSPRRARSTSSASFSGRSTTAGPTPEPGRAFRCRCDDRKELPMKRFVLTAMVAALVVPATAMAKEPSQASIKGPGFSKTLKMQHDFESSPLGPKYTILWTVPMDSNTHRVRQDLYPYATGGTVTYMSPGQAIYNTRTVGGWYRAYGLKERLVSLGLPAQATAAKSSSHASLA